MLQKLLIALCTIFVLSACGGDLDLGPENVPPTHDGGGDGDGDDDEFEPGEPQAWVNEDFSEVESIEPWMQRCADGCNASAALSWNESEEVLVVEPEWASDTDQLEIYTPITEIENLEDAHVGLWVYITDEYLEDGNLQMSLFLENAEGGSAITRGYPIENAGWNKLSIWEIAAADPNAEPEAPAEGEEEPAEDYGSFAWHSDGFTLTDVNTVGVRLSANEKPVSAGGPLWLDNLVLSPAPPREIAPLIVDMESENWTLQDGESLSLQRGDGTVFFNPDGTQQYSPKLAYMLDGPVDISGQSFTVVFSVDEAYISSGGNINAIVQKNFDNYEGNFEGDSVCQVPNAELVAGEETEYVCENLPDFAVAEAGQQLRVGIQADGSDGTVTIHSMQIEGAGEEVEPGAGIEASMTSGWRVSDELLNLTYSDEGVSYSPSDDSQYNQLVYDIAGPIDLSGATYEVVFSVDEDFKAGGRAVQPFAQGNPDFGVQNYDCYVGSASLTAGEDYTATCPALGDAFNFEAEESGVQIGVQVAGDGANQGTVTIKSMTIFLR